MEQSNNQGKIFAQQWSQKPLSDSLQFNGSSLFNFTVTTHINSINLANGFIIFCLLVWIAIQGNLHCGAIQQLGKNICIQGGTSVIKNS